MAQKYNSADDIPDEVIRGAFAKANLVQFSAKPFNSVAWRSVAFGDLGYWLPLGRVLPIVGITPQMLRSVFSPGLRSVPRPFPFNCGWLGLNRRRFDVVEQELPQEIRTYEQLGSFPLSQDRFKRLAKVLGKAIEIFREDGSTGEHRYVMTVHPAV